MFIYCLYFPSYCFVSWLAWVGKYLFKNTYFLLFCCVFSGVLLTTSAILTTDWETLTECFTVSYRLYLPTTSDHLDYCLLFLSRWHLDTITQGPILIYKKRGISRQISCNLNRQREINLHPFSKIIIFQKSIREHNNSSRVRLNRLLKVTESITVLQNQEYSKLPELGGPTARLASKLGADISVSAVLQLIHLAELIIFRPIQLYCFWVSS